MDERNPFDFSDIPLKKLASRYSSRKYPLRAMTILSGHCVETSPSYYYDCLNMKTSTHAAWQLTLSGRGCIEIHGEKRDLLPGSVMIIVIPGPYSYYLPPDSDHWEFVFLTMMGREAVRITRMIEKHQGHIVDAQAMDGALDMFHRILRKLFSGEIDNPFINSSYTYQFCMKFLEETRDTDIRSGKQTFDGLNTFLKANYSRDISVGDMAELMHLSVSHFSRLFTREMGMSPRFYLEDIRLKKAIDLLAERNATVKEISAACGFRDENYFCRLFKKRFGLSPGKYWDRND